MFRLRIKNYKIKSDCDVKSDINRLKNRFCSHTGEFKGFTIIKESIDARKKPEIFKVYTFDLLLETEKTKLISICKRLGLDAEILSSDLPEITVQPWQEACRPVVVGFGPAGMFAALYLALAGARPIVLERGPAMDERIAAVDKLWQEGVLDPDANCQFGEGGAGTFSDGKLTTGTRSEYRDFVLREFVQAGAPADILYKQKPHIGTDILRKAVVNIRKKIESLGGSILFRCRFTGIETRSETENLMTDASVCAALYEHNGQSHKINTRFVFLCTGHSARDTVRSLHSYGIDMSPKQFSMGVRIEHPQEMIDISQYGCRAKDAGLGPADYKLNVRTSDGRGVYTFCMCPGGVVVNASSHEGCITCNGMSYSKRNSGLANSALLADVRVDDFENDGVLAGLEFQEKYERRAFEISRSMFMEQKKGASGPDTPLYFLPKEKLSLFVCHGRLEYALPGFVYNALIEALPMLGKKLNGFDNKDAMIYAIESRSSSPVRIMRSESGCAYLYGNELKGLYPVGEGAGYAGGIMSSACDGVRAAAITTGFRNGSSSGHQSD